MKQKQSQPKREPSLAANVESLLFVADAPVTLGRLAHVLGVTTARVEKALAELDARYVEGGLRIQRFKNGLQLVTAPEAAVYVGLFLGLESRVKLSRAALETLAIIAYRQPVTRPEIEAVRGVSSDSVVRTLLRTGLVEELGRAARVGRPLLYGTSPEFLQHFGLQSLDELPPLEAQASDAGESSSQSPTVVGEGVTGS